MERTVSTIKKLSHKQFRCILKKFRRKKKRQKLAKEKEQQELIEQQKLENSPGYKEKEEEIRRNMELYNQFEERERFRQHKLWLLREEQAQEEFKIKQKQLEIENIKREEERKRIIEEFEKQQFVENKALEDDRKMKSQKEEVLKETLSNLAEDDGPWHNPIAPEHYNVGVEREQCMFFSKTGACRFGERCSRGHVRPTVSCTILIKGMYSHFSIGQSATDDYDTDIALEYEDKERYQDFKNFFNDVLPEFKKFGKVVNFKVCSNFEPHLRGNVYVQFARETDAVEAFKNFNGRYYAGKQLSCEFSHVIRWRQAICGLFGRKLCPKGNNCNFLHVFRSPNNEFWEADRDLPPRFVYRSSNTSRNRDKFKDDRSNYSCSERRSRYESRTSRYDTSGDRHSHKGERYESRSERYESRSERYEAKSDRYEARSEKLSRRNRHESKSNKHESSHYDKLSESHAGSSDDDDYYLSKLKSNSPNGRLKKRDRDSRSESGSPIAIKKSKHKKHKKKKSKKN